MDAKISRFLDDWSPSILSNKVFDDIPCVGTKAYNPIKDKLPIGDKIASCLIEHEKTSSVLCILVGIAIVVFALASWNCGNKEVATFGSLSSWFFVMGFGRSLK